MPWADAPPAPPFTPVEVAVTAESVTVSGGVKMGLAGLHYRHAIDEHWYGGVSVFGATHGDRGGFFAWGLSGGYRLRQGPWGAQAGVFVGGGGGSPAWMGGGLMWRPHVEVSRAWGDLSLGLGLSQVKVPSGLVNGTQPYAVLAWRSTGLFGAPDAHGEAAVPTALVQATPREYVALAGEYALRSSPRRDGTGGAGHLRYGGAAMRRWLPESGWGLHPYWVISAAGAISGGYDGYAEFMGGVGVEHTLAMLPALSLRAEAALGSGGAGNAVDTGGGLLRKVSGGLAWQVVPGLSLNAMAGRVEGRGRFRADELRLEVALRGWDALPRARQAVDRHDGQAAPGSLRWTPWSFGAGVWQYARMQRDDGTTQGLGLLALSIERELDAHWRLVGQAATGISGHAGGYATGHIGVGWLTVPTGNAGWRFGGEASVGAAGGGGVRTAGGLIAEARLQARRPLAPGWAVQADAGWLRNARGTLSSPVAGLNVVRSFTLLQDR